jgi:regulator of protease activity HflC (stomatin/prohibitin superfamily)
MSPYGLDISNCLMTEMLPDHSVLMAMNEINAARRMREANIEKAEAEKVIRPFTFPALSKFDFMDASTISLGKAGPDETPFLVLRLQVLAVKRAEADAEAKHLAGIGTARMRQVRTYYDIP